MARAQGKSHDPSKDRSSRNGMGQSQPEVSTEMFGDEKERQSMESLAPPTFDSSEKDSSESQHSEQSESHVPITRTVSEVRDGIESRRDIELGGGADDDDIGGGIGITSTPEKAGGAEDDDDPNLVTWDGPSDPENPKNWPNSKKWAAVVVVSFFTLISPVSSSMIAPALEAIGDELAIPSSIERALSLSIFVLAYAIGPLFMGPLSELYGRVIVLQVSNLFYLFFNLGCGLARTKGQMIAFRFLSGFGGSAPLAIGGGVLGDLFTAEERGRAMSIYSLAPLLGPAIGPIAGGYLTQTTSWRWIFHATTIADACIQCVGLVFLRETYAPVLLGRKRNRLAREMMKSDEGEGGQRPQARLPLRTPYDSADRTVGQTLRRALTRPFRLLFTQPILQILALYMMYLYGLMYLVLSTFPALWRSYGEGVGTGGLNYIALGVGFFLGAQVCAPLQDRIYARLKARYRVAVGRPEFRVPMMIPGAICVPTGLLVYGWCAQMRTHWIGPDIGAAIFTAGVITGFQCIQGYLVDTYTLYAASAVGAGTVMRSLAGFGFPLFAPYLYEKLDYGWGNTLLAFIAIVVGWPSPILLWKYGEALRKKSPFASGTQGL